MIYKFINRKLIFYPVLETIKVGNYTTFLTFAMHLIACLPQVMRISPHSTTVKSTTTIIS